MDDHDINEMATQDAGLNLIHSEFLAGRLTHEEMLYTMVAYLYKCKQDLSAQLLRIHQRGLPSVVINIPWDEEGE